MFRSGFRTIIGAVAVCGVLVSAVSTASAVPPTRVCRTVVPQGQNQYKFATPQRAVFGDNSSPITYFKFNPTLINMTNRPRFTAGWANVFDVEGNLLFTARKLFCDSTPRGVCFDRYKYEGSTTTQQFITRIVQRTSVNRRADAVFYWQVDRARKVCVATRANRCSNVKVRFPCNRDI